MNGRCRRERGFALVVVLWAGLLVAAIAGAFILDSRTSTGITSNFIENAKARALADGGVHLAMFELLLPDENLRWRRDGRVYRKVVSGGVLHIAIEDEAGKINLNIAAEELLENLFLSAGLGSQTARTMVEVIGKIRLGEEISEQLLRSVGVSADANIASGSDFPGIPALQGASQGTAAGNNRPFIAVDALGQLPGITSKQYARLRPALTVYGNNRGIHYLNAPLDVLRVIPGVSNDAINLFLAARSIDDTSAPLDIFLDQGRARDFWQGNESDFVTVKVLAHADNGAKFVRIAVVDLRSPSGETFIVREWREGDATMFPSAPQTRSSETQQRGGQREGARNLG